MRTSSRPPKCPVCGQPAQLASKPFCSAACRDRDLLKWLGEGYRVPGPAADEAAPKGDDYGLDSLEG